MKRFPMLTIEQFKENSHVSTAQIRANDGAKMSLSTVKTAIRNALYLKILKLKKKRQLNPITFSTEAQGHKICLALRCLFRCQEI